MHILSATWRTFLVMLLVLCACSMPVCAQNSKKVKTLKAQQSQLQQNLRKSQQALTKTGKEGKDAQSYLHNIDRRLDEHVAGIHSMEAQIDSMKARMETLRANIAEIDARLTEKKTRYVRVLNYSRQFPKVDNTLLYVLSSKTLTQMYRRARYAREYVVYQHDLGKQIQCEYNQLLDTKSKLLATQSRAAATLNEMMRQRRLLNDKQVRQQQYVRNLKNKESNLRSQVARQEKELKALNKKIDDLIAYEIEQARKRAEAEARRKAEAKRKAAAKAKADALRNKGTATAGKTAAAGKDKPATTGPAKSAATPKGTGADSWMTADDKKLNGSFQQNKGRLPVPITGQYRIGSRFGTYTVSGLKNVTLDNKGVNYVGKPGARARCVFDGVVTAVFQFGGSKNVLVRHGSYISVYCNLSSVIVQKGQKLKARDLIGTVMADETGNSVLHFQLRKETAKLNPEAWIGR